ncbi:MAG: hypothetical protein J7L08_02585 [Candidatus Aenigmarchaeota archaeon]|nr:hypothetical protein [Candidatus Aenigmarchaeota archaeon]
MDDRTLVKKTEEFVIKSFTESIIPETISRGMVRHLLQTRKYLLKLVGDSQRDTVPLEIAALLYGIEKAFRKNKKYSMILKGREDEEKSAIVAEKFLKSKKAPKALIKKVSGLIKKHESAPTKESKILREADNISFLKNTLPIWFEICLWAGESKDEIIKSAKKIIDKKYNQIKSKEGRKLAKSYHKKWKNWLEQKELA